MKILKEDNRDYGYEACNPENTWWDIFRIRLTIAIRFIVKICVAIKAMVMAIFSVEHAEATCTGAVKVDVKEEDAVVCQVDIPDEYKEEGTMINLQFNNFKGISVIRGEWLPPNVMVVSNEIFNALPGKDDKDE